MDTAISAQQHLFKSLLKIKAVADSPDLPAEVCSAITAPTDAASLNVHARLCKANLVQDAVSIAIVDISNALGLETQSSKPVKKPKKRTNDLATDHTASGGKPRTNGTSTENTLEQMTRADSRHLQDDSDIDDRDLNDRVAVTSDESGNEGEGGSDDVEALEKQLAAEGIARGARSKSKLYNIEDDFSISESEGDALSISPEPSKAPSKKKTSFLPSLTMAGYISGPESDIEEDAGSAPRKNRRGQRARQQIWEQKYGTKAKHLQKPDRNVSWNAKRGAVDGNDRYGRGRNHSGRRASPDYAAGGDGGKSAPRGTRDTKKTQADADRPIHPSWEAAKKAKEKREMAVAFQGKKITF